MNEEIGFRFRFRFQGQRAQAEAKLAAIAQDFRNLKLDEVGEVVVVDQLTQKSDDVPRYYSPTPKYYRYWVARTQQDTIQDWPKSLALVLPVRVVDGCDRFEVALCSADDSSWRGYGETVTEYAPDFDETHGVIRELLSICERHGILESFEDTTEKHGRP
jgi:hypothetical protein